MKVLMINGSPRPNGNTSIALREMEKIFTAEDIETETIQIGSKPIRGCIGCGKCAELGSAFRLVLECEGNGAALLDLNGLAPRVDDKSSGGLGFGDDDALAGFEAGDADFAFLVRPVNAVAVANQRPHDFELGVLERDRGIDGTNFPYQKGAVRRIVKRNGDNVFEAGRYNRGGPHG